MSASAPRTVVFAVGNRSRGDDALGPLLAERLESLGAPGVSVVCDHQLQIEHALEMAGAERVLFVDAAQGLAADAELRALAPEPGRATFSHALTPTALLAVYRQVHGRPPPPAWVLAVAGESFALGAGLSARAAAAVEQAWAVLQELFAHPAADWADAAALMQCRAGERTAPNRPQD
ncbi:hypothetical protein C3497_04500 [Zoogloeaceae bacteirum Par-f-2]|nr:hypothetical protein C3497_04500 [Zoogloeaceae bacteirum Par-f-2]